ncbi:MAG: DNA glycosylase AlkZ-like family protein [Solirubrobacterales bacterium]
MPRAEISDRELRLLRMRAQCLLPASERESVAAATSAALAIQAQDVATGLLGVRARTTGMTAAKAARARGACRSWLMRNTLFLFAERDLAWMRPVLAERPLTPAIRRLGQVGLPPDEVDRLMGVLADRVAAGPLPREEARALLLAEVGDPGENNARIYWTFHAAALRGVIAVRPPLEQKQTFVPAPPDERLGREEALGRLARRFLKGHGPATPDDLAYWAKIPKGVAREAWEHAGRTTEVLTGRGLMTALPGRADPPAASEPVVTLLGAWDHWLLSWADRTLTIPAGQTDIWLVAGRPSAFADGHAFGTWRMERGRGGLTVIVEPFGRLPRSLRPGLEREAADLGRFFEADAELRIAR